MISLTVDYSISSALISAGAEDYLKFYMKLSNTMRRGGRCLLEKKTPKTAPFPCVKAHLKRTTMASSPVKHQSVLIYTCHNDPITYLNVSITVGSCKDLKGAAGGRRGSFNSVDSADFPPLVPLSSTSILCNPKTGKSESIKINILTMIK